MPALAVALLFSVAGVSGQCEVQVGCAVSGSECVASRSGSATVADCLTAAPGFYIQRLGRVPGTIKYETNPYVDVCTPVPRGTGVTCTASYDSVVKECADRYKMEPNPCAEAFGGFMKPCPNKNGGGSVTCVPNEAKCDGGDGAPITKSTCKPCTNVEYIINAECRVPDSAPCNFATLVEEIRGQVSLSDVIDDYNLEACMQAATTLNTSTLAPICGSYGCNDPAAMNLDSGLEEPSFNDGSCKFAPQDVCTYQEGKTYAAGDRNISLGNASSPAHCASLALLKALGNLGDDTESDYSAPGVNFDSVTTECHVVPAITLTDASVNRTGMMACVLDFWYASADLCDMVPSALAGGCKSKLASASCCTNATDPTNDPPVDALALRCSDGIDSDGDGLYDCEDPDCASKCSFGVTAEGEAVRLLSTSCDLQAAVDMAIELQFVQMSDGEVAHVTTGMPNIPRANVTTGKECFDTLPVRNPRTGQLITTAFADADADGLDNDGDGLIDCDDPDCVTIGCYPIYTNVTIVAAREAYLVAETLRLQTVKRTETKVAAFADANPGCMKLAAMDAERQFWAPEGTYDRRSAMDQVDQDLFDGAMQGATQAARDFSGFYGSYEAPVCVSGGGPPTGRRLEGAACVDSEDFSITAAGRSFGCADISALAADGSFPSLRNEKQTPNCFEWAPKFCGQGDRSCLALQAEEARIMEACPNACIVCSGAGAVPVAPAAGLLDGHRRLLAGLANAIKSVVM